MKLQTFWTDHQVGDRDRNPAEEAAGEDEKCEPSCSDVLFLYCCGHMSQSKLRFMKALSFY